jgi:hypothetical protein
MNPARQRIMASFVAAQILDGACAAVIGMILPFIVADSLR